MVAKMITGKTMNGALNYHENKVKEGLAECIAANLFPCRAEELNFHEKKNRFANQIKLNQRSKTNVVHISLNFGIGERLDKEKLNAIATTYMDKIGFGNQPYLVYHHFDAAHPHVHILTTSIQDNGKRIPLHNIGRNLSEKARKEIEEMFNLVQASGKQATKDVLLDPRMLQKASYGKSETKKTISKIVGTITRSYKYTSIPELNAVLQQYNVTADRGKEGTMMRQKGGLQYSIINQKGNKVGVPIKASSIYGKPTLANLEKQFKLNEVLRAPFKKNLQEKVDDVLSATSNLKLMTFINALNQQNIKVVLRQNDEGRIYGITFVDTHNRTVFNGSDLGKLYTANSILNRLSDVKDQKPEISRETLKPKITPVQNTRDYLPDSNQPVEGSQMLQTLFHAKQFDFSSERKPKRRKKKKGRSL
jgi:hypothetical protein